MKQGFAIASGLAVATTSIMSTGCEERGNPFTSSSPDNSIYIALDDDCLLRVSEVDGDIEFARTAPGYGESSASVLGFGGNLPVSNTYTKINFFEAMAFINGDWRLIHDKAVQHVNKGQRKVDPDLIKSNMGLVAVTLTGDEAVQTTVPFKGTEENPNSLSSRALQRIERINTSEFLERLGLELGGFGIPIYIKMNDGTLMRIREKRDINGNPTLTFEKSAAGYAVKEIEAAPFEIGAERGWPVSNYYADITPEEALTYFDDDWEEIYKKALWQYTTWNTASVNPATVAAVLEPLSTNPGGEINIIATSEATVICGPQIIFTPPDRKDERADDQQISPEDMAYMHFVSPASGSQPCIWMFPDKIETADLADLSFRSSDTGNKNHHQTLSLMYNTLYDAFNAGYMHVEGIMDEGEYFGMLAQINQDGMGALNGLLDDTASDINPITPSP